MFVKPAHGSTSDAYQPSTGHEPATATAKARTTGYYWRGWK